MGIPKDQKSATGSIHPIGIDSLSCDLALFPSQIAWSYNVDSGEQPSGMRNTIAYSLSIYEELMFSAMISGQSKNGVLASHADLSQLGEGVISYRLEFGGGGGEAEAEEGKGTELVPHTNILLKAEQVHHAWLNRGKWTLPCDAGIMRVNVAKRFVYSQKEPFIKDVRKIFGIFDPLPTPLSAFS